MMQPSSKKSLKVVPATAKGAFRFFLTGQTGFGICGCLAGKGFRNGGNCVQGGEGIWVLILSLVQKARFCHFLLLLHAMTRHNTFSAQCTGALFQAYYHYQDRGAKVRGTFL